MTSEQGWTYEVHELSEGFSAIVYDQHGQMIADHLTEDRAKLIASAPALLTELESAALALEEASKLLFAKGLQGCASIMAAHCDKARAAIAASGV